MLRFFRTIRKSLLFKGKTSQYLTYAIGEIILVVIGILIALSINNWNSNKKSNKSKELVILKIQDEIKNNIEQLEFSSEKNQLIVRANDEYSSIYHESSSNVISTPRALAVLQNKFPKYYRIRDSVKYDEQRFLYQGGTLIELEIPDLSSIAWETARTISIANEFDYNCLYELENMYNLQSRIIREIDKAADALQKGEIEELLKILKIINQLDRQLLANYKLIIETMDNCK